MAQWLIAWSAPSWRTVRAANVVYFLKLRSTLCSPPRLSYSTLYSFSCGEAEELSVETCQASTIPLLSPHAGIVTVCHKPGRPLGPKHQIGYSGDRMKRARNPAVHFHMQRAVSFGIALETKANAQ